MNKNILYFLLLMLPFLLEASSYKKIVVASFKTQVEAQRVLDFVNEKIAREPSIVKLQLKHRFDFVTRTSGKYHIVAVEPFENKKVLRTILNNIQLLYPDAYVNSVRLEDILVQKERLEIEIVIEDDDLTSDTLNEDDFIIEVIDEDEEIEKENIEESSLILIEENQSKVETEVTKNDTTRLEPVVEKKEIINTKKENSIDGSWVFIALLIALIIVLVLIILLQRKKNKQLTLALKESSYSLKMNKLFLTKISHQLRTSINSIIGLGRILLDSKLTLTQKDQITTITSSGELLINVINDILDYERLESKRFSINKIAFNLDELLSDVGNTLKLQAKDKGLELIFDVDKKVAANLLGDRYRIEQILTHLVNNAIKFTSKGDVHLHVIGAKMDSSHVKLLFEVKDSGVGIHKDKIDSIFTLFEHSVENDLQENASHFEGKGLSLAITKQLIEAMGGKIDVKSIYGRGSSFIFSLNLELQFPDEKRQYRLPSNDLLKKHVLIVDSNTQSTEALSAILEYFHYKVETASDITEAEHILKEHRFDMVFIDEKKFSLINAKEVHDLKLQYGFKLILIEVIFHQSIINREEFDFVDYFVVKPYTKQAIMELIIGIHGVDSVYIEKKVSKRNYIRDLTGARILLVEDNEINQKVVLGLLKDSNIRVDTANNGQEAIDRVNEEDRVYDLILMDVNMPILDGYEATRVIKQLELYKEVPIIALTANIMHDEIDNIIAAGMCEYLGKPINVDVFYSLLIQYLEIKAVDLDSNSTPSNSSTVDGVDKELFFEILDDFVHVYGNSYNDFKRFITDNDYKEAHRLAHNLKGVCATIGAESLANIASQMENRLKVNSFDQMESLLQEFTTQLDEVLELIKSYKEIE